MIDWLYRSSLEISLLIGLVLILRPFVRRLLGAHIAYWLWLLPTSVVFVSVRPSRPESILENITIPDGQYLIENIVPAQVVPASSGLSIYWFWLFVVAAWASFRLLSWWRWRSNILSTATLAQWSEQVEVLTGELFKFRKISFFHTKHVSAPFVTGLIHYSQGYSLEQQKWILLHELSHIKRCDLWAQLFAELVRALFWFNPLVHLGWYFFKIDQELACDHTVLRNSNHQDRYAYGHVLLKGLRSQAGPVSLSFFNSFRERFIMLEKHQYSRLKNILGGGLCVLIGVLALTQAPASVSHQLPDSDERITLKFEEIPLAASVQLIFEVMHEQVSGLDTMKNDSVSLVLEDVDARDLLRILLDCYGYHITAESGGYHVSKLKKPTLSSSGPGVCVADKSAAL